MNQTNWKELLPGCFAGIDAPFGMHSCDEERAISMFHHALCQGAKMSDIKKEATNYLKSQGIKWKEITNQLELIEEFEPNPIKSKITRSKAWLITWEGNKFKKKKMSDRVVNIFDSRISNQRIRDFLENYYIANTYSLFEKATYANNRVRRQNPYPAETAKSSDVALRGLTCGNNPFLFARVAKNLVVVFDNEDQEVLSWEEIT